MRVDPKIVAPESLAVESPAARTSDESASAENMRTAFVD